MKRIFFYLIPSLTVLLLAGCGGAETNVEETSVDVGAESSASRQHSVVVDLSDQVSAIDKSIANKVSRYQVRQANNATLAESASITWPNGTTQFNSNLLFTLAASADVEMTNISISFGDSELTIPVCSDSCGTEYQASVIGLNPALSNVQQGAVDIQIWVTTAENGPVVAGRTSIQWNPISIDAVSVAKQENGFLVSWSADSALQRYNVYTSTDSSLRQDNVLTLSDGQQFLALTDTSIIIEDLDPQHTHYFLVTGVDGLGESASSILFDVLGESDTNPELVSVAVDDEFVLNEDSVLTGNVFENDTYIGDINSVDVTQPQHGSVSISNAGMFTYTPEPNFSGVDQFQYVANAQDVIDVSATVTVTVEAINDAPVAQNNTYELPFSRVLTVTAPGLLANDSDVDDAQLTVSVATEPMHGTLQLNANGGFTFTALESFESLDQFTYIVTDSMGAQSTANVTIEYNPVNLAPSAVNDTYSVNEDNILNVEDVTFGILANDSDPEEGNLTISNTLIVEPSHGTLTIFGDGSFVYVPDANFFGVDTFSYEINDPEGLSSIATASIDVLAVVDAPNALADEYVVLSEMATTKSALEGLGNNDINIEGEALTFDIEAGSEPAAGSVTIQPDGGFTYTPNGTFVGTDLFVYKVTNETGLTDYATVTINVVAALGIGDTSRITSNDTPLTGNFIDLLENVVLEPDQTLSVDTNMVSEPTFGVFEISQDGDFTYTPFEGVSGTDSIYFVIERNDGVRQTVEFTITVMGSNEVPTELADFGRTLYGYHDPYTQGNTGQFNDIVKINGSLVYVGSVVNVDRDIYLKAYNSDGTPLTSFGSNGEYYLNLGADEVATSAVVIDSDIYVLIEKSLTASQELCLIKLDETGTLSVDSGLNNSGVQCTSENTMLYGTDVTYTANKVYAVGYQDTLESLTSVLVRWDKNSLDLNLGGAVYDSIDGSGFDNKASAIKNFHSNNLMIVGSVKSSSGDWDPYVRYVDTNGDNIDTFNGGESIVFPNLSVNGNDEFISLGGDNGDGFTAFLGGYTELAAGGTDALIIALDRDGNLVTDLDADTNNDGIMTFDFDGDNSDGSGDSIITSIEVDSEMDNALISGLSYVDDIMGAFTVKLDFDDAEFDMSFGEAGIVWLRDIESLTIKNSVVDDNDFVWLAGSSQTETKPFGAVLNDDGALFNNFPSDCVSCTAGILVASLSGREKQDTLAEVRQLEAGEPANKIMSISNVGEGNDAIIIAQRYLNNGELDSSFGNAGTAQIFVGKNAQVKGIELSSDGAFYAYGHAVIKNNEGADQQHGFIVRYAGNGELDTSFGNSGVVYTEALSEALTEAQNISIKDIAIDGSYKIAAIGSLSQSGDEYPFVMRLTNNGVLDSDEATSGQPFTSSGYILGNVEIEYTSLVIDNSLSIYIGGTSTTDSTNMWVGKWLLNGDVDTSFGSAGVNELARSSEDDRLNKLVISDSAELYLIGASSGFYETSLIAKVSNNGQLDEAYGNTGFVIADITQNNGTASYLLDGAIDQQNRLVVSGSGEDGSTLKGIIARVLPTGSLDETFGENSDGLYIEENCPQEQAFVSIALVDNESYLVGNQCNTGMSNDIAVSKYRLSIPVGDQ